MILHIAIDEKFIDIAYRTFECAAPKENEFWVLNESNTLTFVKTASVRIFSSEAAKKEFLFDYRRFDFVVLHSLPDSILELVEIAPSIVRFVWLGWGFDYYYRFKVGEKGFLLPQTLALFKKNQSFLKLLRNWLTLLTNFFLSKRRKMREALRKIKFFGPILPNEYWICRKNLSGLKANFVEWKYGTIEDDLSINGLELNGENILLGNSASYSNNHLEALECLKMLKSDFKKKVILPLSYGDSIYRENIIEACKHVLDTRFIPLTEFLHPKIYWQTISSCRYVLMNHLRQQGLGNIIMMLYSGATIFLNKRNPAFSFLVENGIKIYSFEDLEREKSLSFFNLSEREVEKNRIILKAIWGRASVLAKTNNLIRLLRDANR